MTQAERPSLRLRKDLAGPLDAPDWPEGIALVPFDTIAPDDVHAVLDAAFPGLVAASADWHGNLTTDAEFDGQLCLPAVTGDGVVVGFLQAWTSNFIKDLAVLPAHRGKGIGAALMRHAFLVFSIRGAPHVDLKVAFEDAAARRLYARLGMVEVPD
jgi:ribosomal protein S18 acetylase RimI-like enzyme